MQRETKSGKQSSEEQTANLEGQVHPFSTYLGIPPVLLNLACSPRTFFIRSPLHTVYYKLQSVFSNSYRIKCLF